MGQSLSLLYCKYCATDAMLGRDERCGRKGSSGSFKGVQGRGGEEVVCVYSGR
jgi:hypothetical protein